MQFKKTVCPCLDWTVREVQVQEQTQEVKLSDSMPDAGRILACWGQCVLRSKEWRDNGMNVSGGVMTWTLYEPEDGSDPICVESWIPFQTKWDFTPAGRDGLIQATCQLRSVDARIVSARRLMVRVNVGVFGEAMETKEMCLYQPENTEDDVQLLRRTYPMDLPKEAGEKIFTLDEELVLPGSCPNFEKIISYELKPEVLDQKVVGERMVFRGNAVLHLLYRSEEGRLHCWDFDIPFSQFTELDRGYGQDASVQTVCALTSLELDPQEDNSLHLKCGLVAQYIISDREMIELVEDAYSPLREVKLQREALMLPATLECKRVSSLSEQSMPQVMGQVVDMSYLPDFPEVNRMGEYLSAELKGVLQVLYYDPDGVLQCESVQVNESQQMEASDNASVYLMTAPFDRPLAMSSGNGILVKLDTPVDVKTVCTAGLPMVTGIEFGEMSEPDPSRPSVILRRVGDDQLWDLAKRCGSTVEAIKAANDLQSEPEIGRILLIPVP